jgi:uncharacterized YigZ family protein
MKTLKQESESSFTVKKSKFLGLACRVQSEQQAMSMLEQRRKKHFDATHNCYAYILENGTARYSDDGEPQGTAGQPMLEVIRRSGLTNVIVISTRYFGGTLLGAGGLVHAYTKSASDTLENAQRIELSPFSIYRCGFTYETWAKAENILRKAGCALVDIEYSDNVSLTICVKSGSENNFLELVRDLTLGQEIPKFVETKLTEI